MPAKKNAASALLIALGLAALPAAAKIHLHAPDGREVEIKEGAPQPDLSTYRSPLESKIADRRFTTEDGFKLANEEFFSGSEFFVDAVEAGLPVAHWPEFQWATAIEAYWYSRYALEWAATRSHAGLSMVQGPYWTLKARENYDRNRVNRDRGERVPSNKGILLGQYMPLYYQRTGMPRVFDDAAPTYLNFASADPHLVGPVVTADDYEDPQSGKKGDWGVPRYWMDYYNTRWDPDKMDKTIDMGGTAQAALKQALWVQYFWHSDHTEKRGSGDWDEVKLLGNDAEEGFRGVSLSLASFNSLLETKAALFTDPRGRLGGIAPFQYDPAKGLRYIPHLIAPNLVLLGDLPERPWSYAVKDPTSRLGDQAGWLRLCAAYYHLTRHFERAFTDNPPVDGGVLEKRTGEVALGLAQALMKNLQAMHVRQGRLVSTWTPASGAGADVSVEDAAQSLVALKDVSDRFLEDSSVEQALRAQAISLLKNEADFLLAAQGTDGSFSAAYSVPEGKGVGAADLSAPLFWGVRGLLTAWQATKDERYLNGAYKAFNRADEKFWDEKSGLYRTRLGDDTVTLTPKDVAATIGALREMSFAVERGKSKAVLERFTRFWIQAVDVSGLQMSENFQTGEVHYGAAGGDEDDDGIPFVGHSHGRFGVAPVAAGKVYVNIGGSSNEAFHRLPGEPHAAGPKVKFAYAPKDPAESRLKLEAVPAMASIQRTSGLAALASDPATAPRRPDSGLSGERIFKMNCVACHGDHAQGIAGKNLATIATEGGMGGVVVDGRPMQRMPHWGNVLTPQEIARVVEYVKQLFP